MKKTLIGALASLSLAGFALAGSPESTTSTGTGGSGSIGTAASTDTRPTTGREPTAVNASDKSGMATDNELTGKVVKADKKTLYVEHMGAVVQLKLDKKTQYEDSLKSASDLKEGQEVRASFLVEKGTTNLATRIRLESDSGKGGSGFSTDLNRGVLPGGTPSLPPTGTEMRSSDLVPQPERNPSVPLPEEPGTPPGPPTY